MVGYDGVFVFCALFPLLGALVLTRIGSATGTRCRTAYRCSRELGRSGIAVTRVILGCGNFGGVGSAPAFFGQGIARDEAFRIMDAAWELGITTFDTADAYGGGRSETWIGEWLAAKGAPCATRSRSRRRRSTPWRPERITGSRGTGSDGRSRRASQRLGLERVSLYMAHAHDPSTPQEETLSASTSSSRAGKVGAVGASNHTAEQLAEAVEISELEGLTRYEWVQNSFSLLDREDAETVFPVCHEHGLGYEAFGPLAGGWLAGRYRRGEELPGGLAHDTAAGRLPRVRDGAVFDALEALEREAVARGVSMAGARARLAPRACPRSPPSSSARRAPSSSSRCGRRWRSSSRLTTSTHLRGFVQRDRSVGARRSASCSTWSRASRR